MSTLSQKSENKQPAKQLDENIFISVEIEKEYFVITKKKGS